MHLIIDGYNLLYADHPLKPLTALELQAERDRLISQLSAYRHAKSCEVTVVFDGWQGGWSTEKKERTKGIEVIFSRLGERADEVIKRLVREKGAGVIIVTSDRDVSRYAERMSVTAIPSDRFREKMERPLTRADKEDGPEEMGEGLKRKGPSKKLSKRERRARMALKKL